MMKRLDFRLTLFGVTFFFRLLCQYPGVFYYLMVAASAPGWDIFSFTIKTSRKAPIGWKDLPSIFSFHRWKLVNKGA